MNDVRLLSLKTIDELKTEIQKIGADTECLELLSKKGKFIILKISHLPPAPCNIIKQTALSVGTDAAVHRNVITGKTEQSDLLLFGTARELEKISEKLNNQPFGLNAISKRILSLIFNNHTVKALSLPSRKIVVGKKTLIMGVLNVTPDSFSDGGMFIDTGKAIQRAIEMVEEGADIIDIGGESSRPGSEPVSEMEELQRVLPIISALKEKINVPISIDTYKASIAEKAIENGIEIVNDISGLRFDKKMVDVIRKTNVGVIIMHMKGTPRDMQKNPHYDDVIQEIYDFLKERTDFAITKGLNKDSIIIDPGIGFGKRLQDNLTIINRVAEFKSLGFPVLIGASRKSFIGITLDLPVTERLEGSLAACAVAMEGGVDILRVHDVKETKRFIDMYEHIRSK